MRSLSLVYSVMSPLTLELLLSPRQTWVGECGCTCIFVRIYVNPHVCMWQTNT